MADSREAGAPLASTPGAPEETRLAALVAEARRAFAADPGGAPRWIVAAPGRVNLIGEHTDYNGGFVLPMTIDRHVVVAAGPAAAGSLKAWLRVRSSATPGAAEIALDEVIVPGAPPWANYVRGVVVGFLRRGVRLPSLDLVIASDVPLGGGLSSSAALEVATATLIEAVAGTRLAPFEKARLCRQAEQDFAGVPCGIMDQAVCVLGDARGPLLIDCRAETARAVRLADPDVRVLVCDTGVRHALGDGGYARRRAECEEAARLLGVESLRHATGKALEDARPRMSAVAHRRARHVITENARTQAAAAALEAGDAAAAGLCMTESHRSLRDDFEVSCPELDTLVEAALELGQAGGVLGARLTGGGFGGCTVSLVRGAQVGAVTEALARAYRDRHGRALAAFVSGPVRGAHRLAGPEEAR